LFIDSLNVIVIFAVELILRLFIAGDVDEIVGWLHADAVNSTSNNSVNEERSKECFMEPP